MGKTANWLDINVPSLIYLSPYQFCCSSIDIKQIVKISFSMTEIKICYIYQKLDAPLSNYDCYSHPPVNLTIECQATLLGLFIHLICILQAIPDNDYQWTVASEVKDVLVMKQGFELDS